MRRRVYLEVVELRCDMCSVTDRPVRRFSLVVAVKGERGQRATSKGVGTLFLCERCWKTTAGQRRRQFGPREVRVAS